MRHLLKRKAGGRRLSKHVIIRGAASVTMLCLTTLAFTVFFSTAKAENNHMPAKDKRPETVSTKGKMGVSQPPEAKEATPQKQAKQTDKSVAIAPSVTPSASHPKPAWVTKPLFTDPMNGASQYITVSPAAYGANYISRMAQMPVAQWFGDWNTNVTNDANAYVSAAAAAGSVPIVVAYNIPNRDCGGYSIGGANGISVYTDWVRRLAAGIGNRTAVVILEPDALGALDCLPASLQQERLTSISQAVSILKSNANTAVYIDAGTAAWQPKDVMAARLTSANIASADGFSLNVSYFAPTHQNYTFGDQLSQLVGNKHYVVDTSRNGGNNIVTGMQCNPSFASLGQAPTTNTGRDLVDGLLWIKIPWESDGPCNGSPDPGVEYWDYAIKLAQNAGW